MKFLPAIDLMNGQCVRLSQGKRTEKTLYDHAPKAIAARFASEGGDELHVVDLDAAFEGKRKNTFAIQSIVGAVDIPVQLGGGIRTFEDIQALLDNGVHRVILGTAAVRNPDLVNRALEAFGDQRIAVGIDAKSGRVSIRGWEEDTDLSAVTLGKQMFSAGVRISVYTDIAKDGMGTGPNIPETQKFAKETGLSVIASGGISTLDHVKNILAAENSGIGGFIMGKSLHDGRLTVKDVADSLRSAQPHAR